MKRYVSVVLTILVIMTALFAVPAQMAPYEGYPFVFEDFEDGNCNGFTGAGASMSYLEGGVGGSKGAMSVKVTAQQYGDISYACANPPVIGGKLRFSAWIKLNSEMSKDMMSFIFYGNVNVYKTDETVDGPESKKVSGWKQVVVNNAGLKVGEWVKVSYDATWDGILSCFPTVGYNGATSATETKKTSDIVEMTRFSIRVGSMGGLVDLVDEEANSLLYDIDDVTYEIAPADEEASDVGKNIVKNGEFDENYDNWSIPGTKEIVKDGTAPDGSEGYLKISVSADAATNMNLEQHMTWRANHIYKVSYWTKIFDTTENVTTGGSWLLQIATASNRVDDINGLTTDYPGVAISDSMTVGGDWVKVEYYFVNEYKTYTEKNLRTWLRLFPKGKQHLPAAGTYGVDGIQIIDLGPVSGGDMETGAVDNIYFTATAGSQGVLGWNSNSATVATADARDNSAGESSMKVTVDSDGGYAYKGISLDSDTNYKLSFWAKGENLEGEVPFAVVLDRYVETEGSMDSYVVPDYEYYTGANAVSNEYTEDIKANQEWKLTNEWRKYECVVSNKFPLTESLQAPNANTFPRLPFLYFDVNGNAAGTAYYIDDVELEVFSDVSVPKVTDAEVVGDIIPGNEVRVSYTFSNTGEGTDASFVRMLTEMENGEYASLASFKADKSVVIPESAAGKKIVFEIVPVDSENNCGAPVIVEPADAGSWIAMFYDRVIDEARVYASEDISGALVVAAYQEGKLVNIESADVEIAANVKTAVGMTSVNSKEADSLKLMLWDSLSGMKPLCDAEIIDCSTPVETNIYLLGDSVCAEYGANVFWQQGWGHCFPDVVKEYATVYNKGVGGRSSKTYIQQGLWDNVKTALKPGDYVIVNFGLNDIHSPVITETSDGRGTTIDQYKEHLTQYCVEAKELDATPILISTIAEMSNSYTLLQARSKAMKEVAEAQGVAFIDLNTYMNNLLLFDENGKMDTEKRQASFDMYYLSEVAFKRLEAEYGAQVPQSTYDYIASTPDRTHINIDGAKLVAQAIANLLKESDSYLKNYMK